MTNDELIAALEAKVGGLKAQLDQANAEKADLEKKALTPEQVARLQALLA